MRRLINLKYENNWESLNSRKVPTWFEDAKFGIFIHWGLYSVPAYTKKGEYAEWYGYQLKNDYEETIRFHNRVYGENFKYEDFAGDFKAELFNADEWAELFQKSGAKYINLVSKHHDGFCMYKSEHAWNWNSVDVGPHRDFCAELKEALAKTDVKFGVYHSVYEWYHPLYLKDPEEYAVKHLIPMLKELIEKYQPYTLFTDGEWEHPSSVWHSTDFLQWLYNESSVRDYIVPNDRWGSETRKLMLGGNATTEYGSLDIHEADFEFPKPFEECRGIGKSFGLNRIENTCDYLSAAELINLLVDLISRGGNLLLNVGPDSDGIIPVIQQERLLQIGKWLEVNGEAVYCSRKYKTSTDDGVKYTQRDGNVYAFLSNFPFGSVTLFDIDYDSKINAAILGCDAKIETADDNGKLKLVFPAINPDCVKSEYVYCVKLSK